ncbi:hypothetical protein [Arthrobacter sp. H14]|uniref:hypothetical protein n=1 Tax=Arthrobacter sp. H14 TaxID=1312959 RepID=UPI000479C04B|nr:hypothetical protein [Arthrobacter sp. H14]
MMEMSFVSLFGLGTGSLIAAGGCKSSMAAGWTRMAVKDRFSRVARLFLYGDESEGGVGICRVADMAGRAREVFPPISFTGPAGLFTGCGSI